MALTIPSPKLKVPDPPLRAQCSYTEIAQRIFKYSDIQYPSLTLNKKLNSLIYRTLFYVNINGSYKLSETVRFLAHPVL